MIAKLIRQLGKNEVYNTNVVDQRIYHVSPPIKGYDGREHAYVFVSAANVVFSGPETYVFPCSPEGEVSDWGELDGSEKGILDCDGVLKKLGYQIFPE